ncbi:hypothetical protein AB0L20_32350, partial [Streptomyces albidoflavus]|uniref:hypothetical protein n=1 Tax=Streptomyces albidoflavus TaxID=1886 RepID=UPI003444B15F
LTVVKAFGTPDSVVDVLTDCLVRAQDDEILAIAVVEVLRGGDIIRHIVGDDIGFRHQLYAGCGYMQRDLENEGEE